MESQTECAATTNEPIQNTLPQEGEQQGSEQLTHQKADRLRAENRPRRRKVKPVIHAA